MSQVLRIGIGDTSGNKIHGGPGKLGTREFHQGRKVAYKMMVIRTKSQTAVSQHFSVFLSQAAVD